MSTEQESSHFLFGCLFGVAGGVLSQAVLWRFWGNYGCFLANWAQRSMQPYLGPTVPGPPGPHQWFSGSSELDPVMPGIELGMAACEACAVPTVPSGPRAGVICTV